MAKGKIKMVRTTVFFENDKLVALKYVAKSLNTTASRLLRELANSYVEAFDEVTPSQETENQAVFSASDFL